MVLGATISVRRGTRQIPGTDYALSGNGLGVPRLGGRQIDKPIQLRFDVTNIVPSSSVTFSAGSASIIWNNGAHG